MNTNHWYRVSSFHHAPSVSLAGRLAAAGSSKCISGWLQLGYGRVSITGLKAGQGSPWSVGLPRAHL